MLAQYQKLHELSLKKMFKFSFTLQESRLEDEINFLDEQLKLSYTLHDFDDIVSETFSELIHFCELNVIVDCAIQQIDRYSAGSD